MTLLMTTGSLTIAAGAVIFLVITLILVGALLAAKAKLVPSGNVDLKVNGEKDIETPIGSTLLAGLQSGGIFLSSACGGGGKCGQCRAQVLEGGGEILPTEKGFFSRKQIKEHWRLACQCKVKEDMVVQVPDEVFGRSEERRVGKECSFRCKGMGMRSHLQQERGYFHQRVYRGVA